MDIEHRSTVTREEFAGYLERQEPVVITDMASHWPAATSWSFEALRRRAGDLTVTVEYGDAMLGRDFRVETMRLADYLAWVEDGTAERDRIYLSMFSLFETFPDLLGDVAFDEIYPSKRFTYNKGWVGPRGTGTGYHQDFADNILGQIVGRKRVRIVPRWQDAEIYVSRRYDFLSRTASVDPDRWSEATHPRYRDADIGDVTLEPGWMIYIPNRWWHATLAEEASISVNWGGMDLRETARSIPWMGLEVLHRLHLYRWGECACHVTDPVTGRRTVRR